MTDMEDKILTRVRNMLNRAEHPGTPAPEAELCFQQANRLMIKHAIDEALVRASQSESERRRPVSVKINYLDDTVGEFWTYLQTILEDIARTNRCRAIETSSMEEYTIVGFQEDVSWVEMLYTSCYFTFLSKLRPRWNKALGYDENVYNFKVAGYKWYDINQIAVDNGEEDMRVLEPVWNWSVSATLMEPGKKIKGSMITAYKRHARKIGDESPVATQSFEAYRISYAVGFSRQISERLEKMREDAESEVTASHAELVLVSMKQDVDEAFYDMFSFMRPVTPEERLERAAAREARVALEKEARRVMLEGMTPAERKKFLHEEEVAQRRAARDSRRYWRNQRTVTIDDSAISRGRRVADSVNLNRTTNVGTTTAPKEIS